MLATLGYGDAIGHEVLGIQRVLRAAGYESEIFVETADPRLESLTRDYRELVDFSHPDNLLLHHFSLGSKASRTAYALPDRMALIYHNITPPEYFVGVHRTLARQCFRGRRELHAYADRCDLALGDSEFNRQDLEALGFPRTAVLPVVPDFSHLDRPAELVRRAAVRRRLDEHPVRGPGDREQEDRRRDPLLPRVSHDVQPALPAAHRRRVQRVRAVSRVAAPAGRRARTRRNVHFVGHVSDEELVAFYEIADLFLCASEHEGFCVPLVEAFYKQVPVLAYAATAVPATMDGAGVLFDDKDPAARGRADGRDRLECRRCRTRSSTASSPRSTGCSAKDFAGTLLGFVDADPGRAAGAGAARRVRLLAAVRRRAGARGAPAVPPGDLQGAARRRRHDRQPVGAGGAQGDAIGDSARRVRDLLRPLGHESELYALTIDDELQRRRAAVQRSASAAGRPDDLPLRAAVADDRGVRALRLRARPAVSQRHAGGVLRALRSERCSAWPRSAGSELATLVGRVDLALGDLGVQPAGARGARVRADRRLADRRRHCRRVTQPRRAAGARQHPGRRARELSVRRPDRAEQEDRGPHPAGGALQALRRRVLPLHLRRTVRRRAAVLFDDSRADGGVPAAARPLHLHRSGAGRGTGRLLPPRRGLHLAQRA